MQRTLADLLTTHRLEVDTKVALVHAELRESARGLYTEALRAAARDTDSGGNHGGKGAGVPRAKSLYDPRDYKLSDLSSDPSLATFKKWRHDLELFLETIGGLVEGRHCSDEDVPTLH